MTELFLKQELMVHVERIVRPVRAHEGRKLAMRRELLAHLQAALEEERGRCADEGKALEAAKGRLGVPGKLTRGLQRSVPVVERVLLSRVPATRWMTALEKKSGQMAGTDGMTMGQGSLFTLGIIGFSYGGAVLLGMLYVARYREAAMRAMEQQSTRYVAGNLVAGVLLLVFMSLCYKVTAQAARGNRGWKVMGRYMAGISGALMAWMAAIVGMVAGKQVGVLEMACCAGVGIVVTAGLGWVGRVISRVGRPYEEWLSLNVVE